MPAVLIEAGFINDDEDNRIFDENFNKIAQAIADGILKTLYAQDINFNESRIMYKICRNRKPLTAHIRGMHRIPPCLQVLQHVLA